MCRRFTDQLLEETARHLFSFSHPAAEKETQ